MTEIVKALLIPINLKKEILIQDRENYKPPRWGYWGGSLEGSERPIEAVIRESKEELGLKLLPEKLEFIGVFTDKSPKGIEVKRHVFIYKTDMPVDRFNVQEGKDAKWMSCEEVIELMKEFSTRADIEIAEKVSECLNS
jgi:ADP-ribose pyrophosphatase YjhB (NUDIX family)